MSKPKNMERALIVFVAAAVTIFVVSKVLYPANMMKVPVKTVQKAGHSEGYPEAFPSIQHQAGVAMDVDFDGVVPDPDGYLKGVQLLDAGWSLGRTGVESSRNMDLQLRREPRIPKVPRNQFPIHYSSIEHPDFDSKYVKYDVQHCNPPMGGG